MNILKDNHYVTIPEQVNQNFEDEMCSIRKGHVLCTLIQPKDNWNIKVL